MGLFAKLPRWATGAAAQVVEPSEGKKDAGWAPGDKPPCQYENWKSKVIYDCLLVLDGLLGIAATWTAKHTFQAGLASSVAPAAATDVVRLSDVASAAVAGLMSAADKTKLDNATSSPTAARLMLRDAAGRVQVANPSAAGDADTKGARDAAIAVAVASAPRIIAYGTTAQGGGLYAGQAALNVASVVQAATSPYVTTVTFATAQPDAAYHIMVTQGPGSDLVTDPRLVVSNRTANGFDVTAYNGSTPSNAERFKFLCVR